MKKQGIFRVGFCLLLFATSCVEQQNFDQYDEISITPEVEAALLYLEAPEEEINAASDLVFISEAFDFNAFREQYVADHLLEGQLIYQLENTTSKPLRISIEFLDDAGIVLDTETFTMDPAPTALLNREVAYGPAGKSLDIIRNTSGLRISGTNLGDTTGSSQLPDPAFVLRSTAKFRLELR